MKLAYSTLACPDWNLEQCVEATRAYGYDGIELRLIDGALITPDISPEMRRRVKSICDGAGVPIVSMDTSVSLAQSDPDARGSQVRDGLVLVELAAEWGAPHMRVYGNPPKGVSEAEAIAGTIEGLRPLAEQGRELGVCVLIETHDAFCSSAKVMQVLDRVPGDGAGVLWDVLHPLRMGEQPADTLKRLGNRLKHVHIKDGCPPSDPNKDPTDWDLVPLGEGAAPTRDILRALLEAGYDGWLTVEWEKKWHPELAPPEVALPHEIKALCEYLAGLQ
jgi:sugar phosphate isomerase/epimerase